MTESNPFMTDLNFQFKISDNFPDVAPEVFCKSNVIISNI